MPVESVIFDLDGTLAHFNLDFKSLRGEVRSYLIRMSVPTSVISVNESIFEMLKKTRNFLKEQLVNPLTAFDEVRSQALAIAEKYEMEAASTTNLQMGANEMLKELKRMKIKMGLCTTSSEKAANYILQHFKIKDFFQVIVPRNKVKDVKPSTEPFELALKTLSTLPKDTVIVGDSIVDMQSTKELKAIAVGFPTGVSTIEQLKHNGANYIITSLADLPVLIKEINKD